MTDAVERPSLSAILAGEEVESARYAAICAQNRLALAVLDKLPADKLGRYEQERTECFDALCEKMYSAVCAHYEGEVARLKEHARVNEIVHRGLSDNCAATDLALQRVTTLARAAYAERDEALDRQEVLRKQVDDLRAELRTATPSPAQEPGT